MRGLAGDPVELFVLPASEPAWASPGFADTVTTYSRDQIVKLHRQGHTFMDLARGFNLAATSISNWVRAAVAVAGEPDQAKIARMEKQLARKD